MMVITIIRLARGLVRDSGKMPCSIKILGVSRCSSAGSSRQIEFDGFPPWPIDRDVKGPNYFNRFRMRRSPLQEHVLKNDDHHV